MKTIVLNKSFLFNRGTTNSSQIVELSNETKKEGAVTTYKGDKFLKKFKFTYRNGNAFEEFTIELFDGTKLNHVASITDLGVKADKSAYNLLEETDTLKRVKMLMDKGYEYIKLLF